MKLKPDITYKLKDNIKLDDYSIDVLGSGNISVGVSQELDDIYPTIKVKSGKNLVMQRRYDYILFTVLDGSPLVSVSENFCSEVIR